jgi:hypothetical protein
MAHRKALETLDRTLEDIRGNNRPMGGADWQQYRTVSEWWCGLSER